MSSQEAENLKTLIGVARDWARWMVPWSGYVLALLAGRAIGGESTVQISDLGVAVPLAWLAAWIERRHEPAGTVLGALLLGAGLIVGLWAPA